MSIGIEVAGADAGTIVRVPLAKRVSACVKRSTLAVVVVMAHAVDIAAVLVAAFIAQFDFRLSVGIVFVTIAATWASGLHLGRLAPRASEDVPHLVGNVAVAMLAVGFVPGTHVQLGEVAWFGLLVVVLVFVSRALFYQALRRLRRRGLTLARVVIVGAGPTAVNLAAAIDEHPECGLVPLGFVDRDEPATLPLPYLGEVSALADIMDRFDARYAIFAFGAVREHDMISTIRRCNPRSHFYVLFRFFELGTDTGPPGATASIAGFPMRRIHPPAAGSTKLWVKRLMDVVISFVGLVLLTPLMLVCAVLVRNSSPGPILFRQSRVGRDGTLFEILKFRTMTVNEDSDFTWSVENDSRVTPVGRVLRTTHLDELPQLLNVLRGDMSLVGPRPERPFFVDQFDEQVDGYGDRHRVRSGITGWSQVNGLVGDSSIEERARLDNWYIERWNIWTDPGIVLRTIPTMFKNNR